MYQRQSVATSMGFTALDGLMMGTRCGRIDPGVILYLMKEKQYSVDQVLRLLYQESGLLGVSGISNDVQKLELLQNTNPHTKEALELFCYRAILELGSLSMALGGLDAIVFTGGIGEHSAYVRNTICTSLEWLNTRLDANANTRNLPIISTSGSKITVCVIPTNEEYMIASHTVHVLSANMA